MKTRADEVLRFRGRSYRQSVLLLLMVALLLGLACPSANARGRSRGSAKAAAAAAKARKQRAIKALQQQVAAAQQVLSAAESQAAMSQSEVTRAAETLSGIREQIKSERLNVQEANKALQELESEILGQQGPDSDYARTQAKLKSARHTLHRVMHRVLTLPDDSDQADEAARLRDLARLSQEDKAKLEQDLDYQVAQENVKLAARRHDEARRTVLEANAEWVAARKELADNEKSVRESSEHSQGAALSSLDDRQNLHRAQTIAAEARAIIAQGEARLRQLGATPQNSAARLPSSSGKR